MPNKEKQSPATLSRLFLLVLVAICFLTQFVQPSCKIGCLSCDTVDSNHHCNLCDKSIFFHMVTKTRSLYSTGYGLFSRKGRNLVLEKDRGECQLFPECLEVYGEHCAKCSEGYVIGEGDKNEQGVPLRVCKAVSRTVNHCREYQADGLCSQCESGYFLHEDVELLKRVPENDKQCIAWPKEILKCQTHFKDFKNNVRCLECEPGYMLSEKMDRCEEHRDENCLVASNIGCETCFSGFALQETSLNLVPAHLRDFSIGKNILTALYENRKRADLVRCKVQIPFCQRYITISSFDTDKLASAKKDPNEEYISNNEGDTANDSEQSEDERVLLLDKSKTRKLFEIKFGDDEQNKWIIGISKGTRQKMDSGMGQESPSGDLKTAPREPDQEGPLMNDDGEIVTCGRCARGYFLYQVEPLRFECMEAQFIEHCEEYLDRNTCYLCDKHFYLKDGKCIKIDVENFVDHCQYYTPEQDCLVCENEFALLRMVGADGNHPEVTDDFHEAHPYMSNHEEEKEKKKKNQVQLTQKTYGEVIEVEGKRYQKVEQMSITQLMTHETFREYIEGKKTMDDVAQAKIDSLGVHYDLSALHLNFENENANTELFQKESGTEEDNLRHNHELQKEIQRAKELDSDEDERHVDTQQDTFGEQVIEKQVITESSQQSEENVSEGTIVEKGDDIIQKDEDTEIIQDTPTPSETNKTEEDFVVLTEDKTQSRARKLLDLLNIFSSKHRKPANAPKKRWSLGHSKKRRASLNEGRILEKIQTQRQRKLTNNLSMSSVVHSEDVLEKSSSPKSDNSQMSNDSTKEPSTAFAENVVQEMHTSQSTSQVSETSVEASGQDGFADEHSRTSSPSQSGTASNQLQIEKDNGVVLLNESESESVHTMSQNELFGSQTSKSEASSSEPTDSEVSQKKDSIRTTSQSVASSQENESRSSSSPGTESEKLQKVYDSKHIVMESPEDLKNREIQKDKEILDRLFDRESGEGYTDPDKLSDKDEKLRLIHNIINGKSDPASGTSLRPGSASSGQAQLSPGKGQDLVGSGLLEGVNLDGTGININSNQPQKETAPDTRSKDSPKTVNNQSGGPGVQSKAVSSKPTKNVGGDQLKFTRTSGDLEAQPVEQDLHIRPEVRSVMNKRSLCVITNPIPNCSSHFRGECVECEKDFHLINNICKPLSEEHRKMFCQAYNHQQKCIRCRSGFVLVAGSCLKFKEVVNCRNQVYYPNGKCLVCKNGFYFDEDENKCISREQKYFKEKKKEETEGEEVTAEVDEQNGEDIGFDRNCLLIRNNSDKSCFMCKPGFYMDKKGNCLFSDGGYSKSKWSLF